MHQPAVGDVEMSVPPPAVEQARSLLAAILADDDAGEAAWVPASEAFVALDSVHPPYPPVQAAPRRGVSFAEVLAVLEQAAEQAESAPAAARVALAGVALRTPVLGL